MERVQIYRGRKDPPNTKRVCRPSRWGNPYSLSAFSRNESLLLYRTWLSKKLWADHEFIDPLVGFHLGCYCKPEESCHADILLKAVKLRESFR